MASAADRESILALKTVGDAPSRLAFLGALRELGAEGRDFTLEGLRALMEIEEHFQALVLYDQIEFLRSPDRGSEADREFGHGIREICLEAANGYQRFLRSRESWATSREALEVMFRATGLALNAIHCYTKWGYFTGEGARAAPWKQIHTLYALADVDGFSQMPFVLYASQPSFKPSVQSLYLRCLLLDLLNTGSLSRIQVEIADGWFSSWCNDYSLDAEYSSRQHLFYVDLASDSGMHLMRKDSHGESIRYLRIDGLKAQIDEVQTGLRHGRLYAGYGAGAVFPVEQHVALLAIVEKLYESIVAGSENRIEERTHFEDREVDVAVGIERVLRKAREAPSAASAQPATHVAASETFEITPTGMSVVASAAAAPAPSAPEAEVDRWRVYDLSSNGFGLLVDRVASEVVHPAGVIALRNHERGGWILGTVVRKLTNRVAGETLVGVEVLCYRPIAVECVPAEGGVAVPALFLPGTDANGKQDSILVRIGDFRPEQSYSIVSGSTAYRIRLNRILRKGADWIRARFEIESRA